MYTSLEPDAAPGLSADLSQDVSGRALVEVRTVSGKVQAVLSVGPEESVRRLKSRVLEMDSGADLGKRHFKLVHDCTPLPECRMLRDCVGPADWSACCEAQRPLPLTMVLPSTSSLAACVQALGLESGGDSAVMDVADSVWQAEHALAARHQPTAAEVAVGMPHETRVQVVEWLGMACEATLVDEALLHGAVLTLDRFAATASEAVDRSVLLRLSLASLATEMKLTSEEDFPSGHWQRVLLHLSQGGETLPDILDAEARMLRRLGFVVGVPTPLSFLSGLSLRLAAPCPPGVPAGRSSCGPCPATPRAALQTALARLLVELALHDLQLAYRYPPALLAAGALGAALLVVGPEERTDEVGQLEALRCDHDALVDDLYSYAPHQHGAEALVLACEREILALWRDSASRRGRLSSCFAALCQRHVRSRRNANVPGGAGGALAAALVSLQPELGLGRLRVLSGESPSLLLPVGEEQMGLPL